MAGSKEEDASRILVLSGWWYLKGKALQMRADVERVFIAVQVKNYSFLYTSLTLNIRNDIDRVSLGRTDTHGERLRDWESNQELCTSTAPPVPSNSRFKERSIHQTSGQRRFKNTLTCLLSSQALYWNRCFVVWWWVSMETLLQPERSMEAQISDEPFALDR